MVCIAAFIVLALVGVFVAVLSIFKRDIGQKYWAVFKKAWGCVGKKVRLQKCETNFKDDVKNSLLSRVVLKHPTWVKPLGAAIEVSAVVIVIITIWSLIEVVKALLALWVFGTCNVSQPASCALGAEVCGIDETDLNWFSEWGEIFSGIPEKFHTYSAEDYLIEPYTRLSATYDSERAYAIDIFDPGCTVCLRTYQNQLEDGFMERYNVIALPYVIEVALGEPKFNNSDLIVRYIHAAGLAHTSYDAKIIHRLFTEESPAGESWQVALKNLSATDAESTLQSWLRDFGATKSVVENITQLAHSAEVDELMNEVRDIVENQIHAKGIPTEIYDGKRHNGLYKGGKK